MRITLKKYGEKNKFVAFTLLYSFVIAHFFLFTVIRLFLILILLCTKNFMIDRKRKKEVMYVSYAWKKSWLFFMFDEWEIIGVEIMGNTFAKKYFREACKVYNMGNMVVGYYDLVRFLLVPFLLWATHLGASFSNFYLFASQTLLGQPSKASFPFFRKFSQSLCTFDR